MVTQGYLDLQYVFALSFSISLTSLFLSLACTAELHCRNCVCRSLSVCAWDLKPQGVCVSLSLAKCDFSAHTHTYLVIPGQHVFDCHQPPYWDGFLLCEASAVCHSVYFLSFCFFLTPSLTFQLLCALVVLWIIPWFLKREDTKIWDILDSLFIILILNKHI